MDRKHYYEALCSHDSRFDGRFFVGVSSTGIYCRPVCRVRTPKEENCTFFQTAAEAEQAGYRPCLRCRPELAPGSSALESGSDLARAAARELERTCGSDERLEDLAARLGCTDRHLRRVFEEAFHVTPVQYRQTCRLLLAKKLLTDTDLPVLDVAMACGFGSLRRFNAAFAQSYKCTPTTLRKQRAQHAPARDCFTVEVGYRPPYGWQEILSFLGARAIPGVETVRDDAYLRTVRMGDRTGWVKIEHRPQRHTLAVTLSASLLRVLPQVLERVRCLFDTDSDPETVREALESMGEIDARLPRSGLRVPGCFDPFETGVRAILGQQITVKAAATLAGRMARTLGTPLETGVPELDRLFPSAEDMLSLGAPEEQMGALGIIGARAGAIKALAALHTGTAPVTRQALLEIRGVGPWTADYIAMRTLGETDVFLSTDYGVKKALAPHTQAEMNALAEAWRPWRSYAVMNLWNMETGGTDHV